MVDVPEARGAVEQGVPVPATKDQELSAQLSVARSRKYRAHRSRPSAMHTSAARERTATVDTAIVGVGDWPEPASVREWLQPLSEHIWDTNLVISGEFGHGKSAMASRILEDHVAPVWQGASWYTNQFDDSRYFASLGDVDRPVLRYFIVGGAESSTARESQAVERARNSSSDVASVAKVERYVWCGLLLVAAVWGLVAGLAFAGVGINAVAAMVGLLSTFGTAGAVFRWSRQVESPNRRDL